MNPDESATLRGREPTRPTFSELARAVVDDFRSYQDWKDNLLTEVALEYTYTSVYDGYYEGRNPD